MIYKGALNEMLGTVRSLQLIVHLPLINVTFPANVGLYFTELIALCNYDPKDTIKEPINDLINENMYNE